MIRIMWRGMLPLAARMMENATPFNGSRIVEVRIHKTESLTIFLEDGTRVNVKPYNVLETADMRNFKVKNFMDAYNSEYEYGHSVSGYHSDGE